jgi:hypothetical protein
MKTLLIATTLLVSATCTYAAPAKTTKSTGSSNKSTTMNRSVTTNKSAITFNKSGNTHKVINHNTGNKSVSVFSGNTHHARNHTQFFKTVHGHRGFARNYCGWTHRCFFPRFGCYGYYCPSTCGWFYLYAAGDCYMPVDAMQNFPPTPNDTGDNGTPVLPEGAEPINEGTPLPPQ